MRRAWLLSALLAAPALAAAQAAAPIPQPGQITFPDVARSPQDGFINLAECQDGTLTIELSWQVTGSLAGITSYELFAANRAHPDDKCWSQDGEDGTTSLQAGSAGTISEDIRDVMMNVAFSTSEIARAAGFEACSETSERSIELCIQARAGTAEAGRARGRLTLSLVSPRAPTGVSVSPGEGALNVSWDRVKGTSGTPPATDYQVDAVTVGTADPVPLHSSGRVSRSEDRPSVRLEGLVNGETYEVTVTAFSSADNPSDPSAVVTASPVPVNDFFEAYKAMGGVEEGGCASGTAGPVAVGLVALLLATLAGRRRP